MKKFQVLYSKCGYPLTFWADDEKNAEKFADSMRRAGYDVSIWEHTDQGARQIK